MGGREAGFEGVRDRIDYALGDDEVCRLAGGVPWFRHSDLAKARNFDDLLGPYPAGIMLYETTSPQEGHWMAVLRHGPEEVELFDPYNAGPPDVRKYGHYYRATGTEEPRFAALVARDPRVEKVWYNDSSLQVRASGVNTCGRWAGLRALFHNLPYDAFVRRFGWLDDAGVTSLTNGLF